MIPKYVHYCWFGKGEKSELSQKCIMSWKRFLTGYTFIEWNEDNCDIGLLPYVHQAYDNKKYAFVSDYFRLKALYEYGGIYFDTDYELIKPIDSVLKTKGNLITGLESIDNALTAIIITEAHNSIIKELMDTYQNRQFVNSNGQMDLTPINVGFSHVLQKYGIDLKKNEYQRVEKGIVFYPIEVLCGFDVENWHERIDKKTIGVHHMGTSWATPEMKKHIQRIHRLQLLMGYNFYDRLKAVIKRIKRDR